MMILNKNEIKVVKAFLIEMDMTRKDFAQEAEIGIRTLYNALNGKVIKEETYDKIINVIISETIQRSLIQQHVPSIRKQKTIFLLKTISKPVIYILVITAFVLLMNWLVK